MPVRHFKPTDHLDKPSKPYDTFPLFAHDNGCWCKKIRGRLHYFGPWTTDTPDRGADAALAKYLAERDDLHAGRVPRPDPAAVTVKDVANAYLNHKKALLDAGELSLRTWAKYKEVADLIVDRLGKGRVVTDLRPGDFAALKDHMTRRWGPLRVADFVQHVRSAFGHAFDAELIDRPVRFGPGFERPSQKVIRLHRAKQGPKLFTRENVRRLLEAAPVPVGAMIYLGMNCAFGNNDVATLPLSALDLDGGWVDFPRPKTGARRRCPLWPESVAALAAALAVRPTPKDGYAGLAFLSSRGTPWVSLREKDRTDGIAIHFGRLLRKLGISGRKGLGYYTLRHTFRTVADEAKDQPAADYIMGHEAPHMSSHYRERVSDERLKAVTDHVRGWLFGEPA